MNRSVRKWLCDFMVEEVRVLCAVSDAMQLSMDYPNLCVVVVNRDSSEVCRFMNGAGLVL